jgi:hypothetical protein
MFVVIVFNEFSHNLSHAFHFHDATSQDVPVLSRVLVLANRESTVMESRPVNRMMFTPCFFVILTIRKVWYVNVCEFYTLQVNQMSKSSDACSLMIVKAAICYMNYVPGDLITTFT